MKSDDIIMAAAVSVLAIIITIALGLAAAQAHHAIEKWKKKRVLQKLFLNRTKADILIIGTARIMPNGGLCADGWKFDLKQCVPEMCLVTPDGETVVRLIAGYTDQELVDIATRKTEWQD